MSVQKMNPEVKAKWLAALRSGEYKQGCSFLHRANDAFCCLGVLCDIAVKDGVIDPPVLIAGRYAYKGAVGRLPLRVAEWSGVADVYGSLGDSPSLVRLNDHVKLSFAEIADIIEEQL